MRWRGIVMGLLAVPLGGCSLVFGNPFSHVIDKPQSELVAALADMDFEKSTDFAGPNLINAAGIKTEVRLEKAADHLTWWMMTGDKVAMTMTASFEPIDGGKRTRLTTAVARGDAPDAIVAPVFQSPGAVAALFAIAIDAKLQEADDPPRASTETCTALMDRFRDENLADPDLQGRPDGFAQGVGQAAKTIARLRRMEAEARLRGCPIDRAGRDFAPVSNKVKPVEDDGVMDQSMLRDGDPADMSDERSLSR